MVTVPLGVGAYKRTRAGEPEIRLLNRFLERAPTNLRERIALLSRPGSTMLDAFPGGALRACWSKQGLFGTDLFVVSGPTLYRFNDSTGRIPITGTIGGSGQPAVTWAKGAGYERLFIADGSLLQYYGGPAHATGVLTLAGGSITNQVIKIGTTYYTWGANVNAGAPAGTLANPWIAHLGANDAESLLNLERLLNFSGISGIDYSTALGGASTDVTATSDAAHLTATAIVDTAAGNAIATTVQSGSFLTWGDVTLTGGGAHALHGITMPDGVGAKALAEVSSYVLVSVVDTQKFFWLNPGEVVIDALNFANKESNPDPIIEMLTVGDQVAIMGAGSIEWWYATGDNAAPFAPIKGRAFATGAVDGTAVVVEESIIFIDDKGKVSRIGAGGGALERISDHGIEERISKQLRFEEGLS